MSYVMRSVTALELRQSLSRVVSMLEEGGEPVILCRGRRPVAALVSLRDFRERFVEQDAAREREHLLQAMDELARLSADPTPSVEILRSLRGVS